MRMWCRPTSTPEAPRSKPRSLTMGPRAVLALCCCRFRNLPTPITEIPQAISGVR